jgi:EmrB/QacA subfamily drug resistance transporter
LRTGSWVLLGCVLGIFLAAIEGTVIGTVMPTVVADLGGLAKYQWVFTVYMLSAAVTMPLWGKLADLHGARRYFVAGVVLFLTGSILAGTSRTMDELVAFRALQGLGAGAMFSLPMTILGNQTSPERRGHVLGFAAATWGFSALVGPPVGALVVALLGWRWVFYLNIPFGIAAIVLVLLHYRDPERQRRHRLDFPGALLIMGATASLLLGTQAYREGTAILGVTALQYLLAFVVLVPIIVLVERRAREPIIPLMLFRDRTYRIANAAAFLFAFCVFSAIVYVPMMATLGDPTNVLRAGLSLIPASLGWTTGAFVGGRLLVRVGARRLALLGAILGCLGFAALTQIGPGTPIWRIIPNMFPIGLGIGLSSPAILVTLQNRFGATHMGVVTSGVAFWRHLGGTLGITLLGLLVPAIGIAAITAGVQHVFMAASVLLALTALLVSFLPRSVLADPEEAGHAALTGAAELGMPVEPDDPRGSDTLKRTL